MNSVDLNKIKKVHFIGIGGIGVSAIARTMLHVGKKVSGSDNSASDITRELTKEGALILEKHKAEYITPDIDLVVFTAAIPKDNVELVEAQQKKLPTLSYSEMLGLVSKGKKVIAVSGTHGKTTTTAMIAEILMKAGLSPTVIVGSLLSNPRTNFVPGESDLFLTEADEYKKSFLSLHPYILVITNIDLDHLDFYKDLSDIQNAFGELVARIPHNGVLVCDATHPHLASVISRAQCKVVDYKNIVAQGLTLKVPGIHNRENAKAALAVSQFLGVSQDRAITLLNGFIGAWRRFEYKGKTASGAFLYDDYAHNPQKVEAVISGARELFPDKKIIIAFQPHLYSRTKLLLKEFSQALSSADNIVLAPIYGARESFDSSISSHILAEEIKKYNTEVVSVQSLDNVLEYLAHTLKENDVCLLVGAGDIYTLAPHLVA